MKENGAEGTCIRSTDLKNEFGHQINPSLQPKKQHLCENCDLCNEMGIMNKILRQWTAVKRNMNVTLEIDRAS